MTAQLADANSWIVSANATSDISMRGLSYKQGQKEYDHKPGSYTYVDGVDVDGAGISGFGLAFDLGGSYTLNNDWSFSAALLDLGFISWSNNIRARNTSGQFTFNGFQDVDVARHGGLHDAVDPYADQIADFIHLQNEGDQGGRTTGIGMTINIGADYRLPVYRKLSFGLLANSHIQGDYSWTEARLSANWNPVRWLNGGLSMGYGSFGVSAGWIINVHPKGLNFFIGMDHLLGRLSKELIPLNSKASLNLGINFSL